MIVDKTPYIKQLQQIYFEKYHETLCDNLAHEYFDQLVTLLECIYRPIPKELDKAEKVVT